MAALWIRLQGAILTALAVLAVLFGAYYAGGRAAREGAAKKSQARVIEAAEDRKHVEQTVDRMSDDDVAERLRDRWSRPD